MAAAQPIAKFVSKPDSGGPNGFFPSGNPSIEVGGYAPHGFLGQLLNGLGGYQGPSWVWSFTFKFLLSCTAPRSEVYSDIGKWLKHYKVGDCLAYSPTQVAQSVLRQT